MPRGVMLLDFMVFVNNGTSPALLFGMRIITFNRAAELLKCSYVYLCYPKLQRVL